MEHVDLMQGDVLRQLYDSMRLIQRDQAVRPAQVRMTGDRWHRLASDLPQPNPYVGSITGAIEPLFGITVILDDHLLPGQWRFCASDGALLLDSMSGKTLREVLADA